MWKKLILDLCGRNKLTCTISENNPICYPILHFFNYRNIVLHFVVTLFCRIQIYRREKLILCISLFISFHIRNLVLVQIQEKRYFTTFFNKNFIFIIKLYFQNQNFRKFLQKFTCFATFGVASFTFSAFFISWSIRCFKKLRDTFRNAICTLNFHYMHDLRYLNNVAV